MIAQPLTAETSAVLETVLALDAWLDTMRATGTMRGYTGPVVHWWQNCLQYTGTAIDWRYEGIITGYLNLYRKTGDSYWLDKATRAGDDAVHLQLESGNFYHSAFELNPHMGGTPHEGAVSNGLLRLAELLKAEQDARWQKYFEAAARNLRGFYINRLWDDKLQAFRDHPQRSTYVPNKTATLAEALFALARLSGDDEYAEVYALPALNRLLEHQVRGGRLDGGVYQNTIDGKCVEKIFPYYVGRCIPGLLEAYRWSGGEQYLDAALRSGEFLVRVREPDGSFPLILYPNGRANPYFRWIAPLGDVLYAWEQLTPFGFTADSAPTLRWLLGGRLTSGSISTASGFAEQFSQRPPSGLPDFRDLIGCCGWVDKAFRHLTSLVHDGTTLHPIPFTGEMVQECQLNGEKLSFYEDKRNIELRSSKSMLYLWIKGQSWAKICAPSLLWK